MSRNKIVKEFCVLVQWLRSQLNGNPIVSSVQGLYLRELALDQKKVLHNYFIQLNKTGMPTYLYMIECTANLFL